MKYLNQTLIVGITLAVATASFAQSPTTATRQRKTVADGPQQPAAEKSSGEPGAEEAKTSDKKSSESKTESKSQSQGKPSAEITPNGQTNRTDPSSEEAAIIPYYNNFFTTYRLGPEDVISVTVFGQDRYSKQGIVIPPSGRISLALIPDGIFVNGKTVDQVAELIKKRYDEYIIDPQVSVSLDRAGSYRYSVVGDVALPGIKPMNRRLSVSEAIAEAGGVLQTGNRKKIVVLRKQANGTLAQIPVNLTAIYHGQAPDSVYLAPGDQVIVPGNTLKKLQTILGFTQVLTFANLFRHGW